MRGVQRLMLTCDVELRSCALGFNFHLGRKSGTLNAKMPNLSSARPRDSSHERRRGGQVVLFTSSRTQCSLDGFVKFVLSENATASKIQDVRGSAFGRV